MTERKMGLACRQICECVQAHPEITVSALVEKIKANRHTIATQVQRLVDQGYIKRGARGRQGYQLRTTGQWFPASADWKMTPVGAERLLGRFIGKPRYLGVKTSTEKITSGET